jgi:predicted membrane-bound spermidine synthase
MAGGAWLAGRRVHALADPIAGYAAAEGVLGLAAFMFHPVFTWTLAFTHDTALPALPSSAASAAWQWAIGALLILPQSVVLGATFPLMAAGMLRRHPETPGADIGLLYFANSIGGVAGVLCAGFALVRVFGLPGTLVFAGCLNLLLCALAWAMRGSFVPLPSMGVRPGEPAEHLNSLLPLLLLAAAVTGAASFVYEIVWIRMLSLVLGTSTHAFELMLGAFILGLACGSLWIRRRIDRLADPGRWLATLQISMGALALGTLPLYGLSFSIMQRVVMLLPKTGFGYAVFLATSNGIALAILLPATFCAGTTLPLITTILLKRGRGEVSVGNVYAANTLGGIIGVVVAVHIAVPLLGLTGALAFGAALDIALGLVLAWRVAPTLRPGARVLLACGGCAALGMAFYPLDQHLLASGVYRNGARLDPSQINILAHRDGKTATVHILSKPGDFVLLRNNGKTDASINISPGGVPSPDEPTMALAAALPLAFRPGALTAANIGMGSGLTSHILLLDPVLKRVDTIEIEQAVADLSRYFRPRNERVYTDQRSAIHIDDAKSFFSRSGMRYDIIVSEPANPWVSGVAGLFSQEFYLRIRGYLAVNGVFAQWLQLYETDLELSLSILKAIDGVFSDWALYTTNDTDMIIVGTANGQLPELSPNIFALPSLAPDLARIGVRSPRDLEVRRIADRRFFRPFLLASAVPANSDYRPYVDQHAGRAQFLRTVATELLSLNEPLPAGAMLGSPVPAALGTPMLSPHVQRTEPTRTAFLFLKAVSTSPPGTVPAWLSWERPVITDAVRSLVSACADPAQPDRVAVPYRIALEVAPYLQPAETELLWATLERWPCGASLPPDAQAWWELFRASGSRNARVMAAAGRALLDQGTAPPARRQYLFAAALLGAVTIGDNRSAQQLWKDHRDRVFGTAPMPLAVRLVAAHANLR